MNEIIETRGVLEEIYKWLSPSDKKALSLTCKTARLSYLNSYFAQKLKPAKLNFVTSIHQGARYKCMSCQTLMKSLPHNQILGMVNYNTIQVLRFCGKHKCKELAVRRSFIYAVESLLIDGGDGVHVPRSTFYHLFERCLGIYKTMKFRDILLLHNSIISAFVKQVVSGDVIINTGHIPNLDMLCYYYRKDTSRLFLKLNASQTKSCYVDFLMEPSAKRINRTVSYIQQPYTQQQQQQPIETFPQPMDIVALCDMPGYEYLNPKYPPAARGFTTWQIRK